jgi:cytidylate kinase
MRDYIDSNRKESPLRQADDAILLDNTNLDEIQTLHKALQLVKRNVPA